MDEGDEDELYYGNGQSGSEDSEYNEGVDSDSNDENHRDNEYVGTRCARVRVRVCDRCVCLVGVW